MADQAGMGKVVFHYGAVLLIVCLIAAVSLGFIYTAARPQMDRNDAARKEAGLKELFADVADVTFTSITAGGTEYTEARAGTELIGYAAEGSAEGYQSTIQVMVRTDRELTAIKSLKVLASSETPGLGERVKEVKSSNTLVRMLTGKAVDESGLKPWFQEGFNNLSLDNMVVVKTTGALGVLAISGATISSQGTVDAAIDAVNRLKTALGIAK